MSVPETQVGLFLPCPCCGEENARILFDFSDETLECGECNEEFTDSTIRAIIARWQPVLKWLDTFPRSGGE